MAEYRRGDFEAKQNLRREIKLIVKATVFSSFSK